VQLLLCPNAADPSSNYWGSINFAWNGKQHSAGSGWDWLHTAGPPEQWWVGSYGFNGWMYSNHSPGDNRYFLKLTAIRQSTNTPMFFDAMWVDAFPDSTDATPPNLLGLDMPSGNFPVTHTGRVCINRHTYAVNMVFADGSARTVPLPDLHKLVWYRGIKLTDFSPPLPKK
jgi:prepilin-type processing-associated H-X9-DG protein